MKDIAYEYSSARGHDRALPCHLLAGPAVRFVRSVAIRDGRVIPTAVDAEGVDSWRGLTPM